jgi:hypothetical protein
MDAFATGLAGYWGGSGAERLIDQEIRENDHKQIKVLLDYYRQTIGPFPSHIAAVAEEWEHIQARH